MIKIFDSTVIIAFDREIMCVNLFDVVTKKYSVYTSNEVKQECRSTPRIDNFMMNTLTHPTDLDILEKVYQYLGIRYNNRLGAGERSCMALSMLQTQKGVENYLVTDDRFARQVAEKIHSDPAILTIFGSEVQRIKYTGTIGLIKHLVECGEITKETSRNIAEDLKNSGFRVSQELLSLFYNQM